MTSTDTLLPCPFCGDAQAYVSTSQGATSEYHRVACYRCDAATGPRFPASGAIAAWNRRTPPTPATDDNPFVGTNWQVRSDTLAADEREAAARGAERERALSIAYCKRWYGMPAERERDALREALGDMIALFSADNVFNNRAVIPIHAALLNARAALTANHSAPVVEG